MIDVYKRQTISLALAFVGCVLVAGIGQAAAAQVTAAGIIAGVLSGFGYALYSIFGRYALDKKYDSQTITAYTFVFAAIGCSFLAVSYTHLDVYKRQYSGCPAA